MAVEGGERVELGGGDTQDQGDLGEVGVRDPALRLLDELERLQHRRARPAVLVDGVPDRGIERRVEAHRSTSDMTSSMLPR